MQVREPNLSDSVKFIILYTNDMDTIPSDCTMSKGTKKTKYAIHLFSVKIFIVKFTPTETNVPGRREREEKKVPVRLYL